MVSEADWACLFLVLRSVNQSTRAIDEPLYDPLVWRNGFVNGKCAPGEFR